VSGFFSKVDFLAPADEDDPRVLRALGVENFLDADERIVWRARPSSRHAWGDHDQLEPVRGTTMQPASRVGRILVSSLCTALILALAAGGWVLLTDAVETSNAQRWAGAAVSGMLGLTMLSGLPILFRPFVNMLRARRLGYVLTSRRALVVRRGPGAGHGRIVDTLASAGHALGDRALRGHPGTRRSMDGRDSAPVLG